MEKLQLILVIGVVLMCWLKISTAEQQTAIIPTDIKTGDDSTSSVEIETDDSIEYTGEKFIPTHEWQTIKPGQSIPRGLHVRLNLQTGLKEAKLLDKEEEKTPALHDLENDETTLNGHKVSVDRLKEALKDFKAEQDDVKNEEIKSQAEELKKKYRNIDELKKDFDEMNLGVKTDNEIITELLNKYNTTQTTKDKLIILEDLEYYLHQIDNAKDFVDMGGLQTIIGDLNNTDDDVKSGVAAVLGACLQSNPKVQVKAIEAGVLHKLLSMLTKEKSMDVKNKVLYAQSSLIRHFPYAQKKFLEHGGISVLKELFSIREGQKIQLKAVTLMNDLLLEHHQTKEHAEPDDKIQQEKLRQYKQVPLLKSLVEQGWCDLIPRMLLAEDHDSREKVLHAMETLSPKCNSVFRKSISTLQSLQLEYEHLALQEKMDTSDDGEYFHDILTLANTLISKLTILRDEL